MKPKLALAIFLLVVSNLTAYRAGKRVADWWYAAHPKVRIEYMLRQTNASTAEIGTWACFTSGNYSWHTTTTTTILPKPAMTTATGPEREP